MVYVRDKMVVTMRFAEFGGLVVNTVEPSAQQWEDTLAPLLDNSVENPLSWIDEFIACLDSWDLKYADGTSVPCTRDALMSHDLNFVQQIVRTWMNNGLIVEREGTTSEEAQTIIDPDDDDDPLADLVGHDIQPAVA